MPVSSWSPTPASNTGILTGITLDGASLSVPMVDDAFREMAAQIAQQLGKIGFKGGDMPSAATVNLATATGWYVDVTGTTTITSLGTVDAGQVFILRFASSLLLTHHAANLILPNGNIYTTGGDVGIFVSLGAGAWKMLNYIGAGSNIPAGSIIDFAGTTAPTGWLMCYGQSVSRATYAALFTAIGTTYGAADGSSFSIPDLRGRVVAGKDDMGGTSANRLTVDFNGDILGMVGGSDVIALTTANMPSHSHGGWTQTQNVGHTHSVIGNTGGQSVTHTHDYQRGASGNGTGGSGAYTGGAGTYTTNGASTDHTHAIALESSGESILHSHSIQSEGGGTAHVNMQPTLILQKIIKV